MIHFRPPERDYFYTLKRREKVRQLYGNLTIEDFKKKELLVIHVYRFTSLNFATVQY